MREYEKPMIQELLGIIKEAGFTPYLAERGNYGFYTDQNRVVCFSVDLGRLKFSGNYKTNTPISTGNGWGMDIDGEITPETIKAMIKAEPPMWAVGKAKWKYKTFDQYMAEYQGSSKFATV